MEADLELSKIIAAVSHGLNNVDQSKIQHCRTHVIEATLKYILYLLESMTTDEERFKTGLQMVTTHIVDLWLPYVNMARLAAAHVTVAYLDELITSCASAELEATLATDVHMA